ncbi:MAG: hypothetical protein A2029_13765 [Chloroflexi bacterium RBG_19FT_COMBO_47_9]|nr:MAG: hypothetical protein A2029_13765 [Chloroflexi bacterium RBG_19FT_COMBO_47_9]
MDNSDFIQWLLQAKTPSIREITLRRLLCRPEGDADVEAEKQRMKINGPIPVILSGQTDAGRWSGEQSYYTPKYTSTHWSMLILTELGADGSDPRMIKGVAFMLAATYNELEMTLEKGGHGHSCFWGNLLRYALHCSQADKSQIQNIIHYLANDAQNDWCCSYNGGLPCAWGVARALWGLAAVPSIRCSHIVEMAIQNGIAFLLENDRLITANYPTPGRIHPLWFRLNFPLFYQADILFVLRVLSELNSLDHPGVRHALEWLASRRVRKDHWHGSSPFRRRTWSVLSDPDETSRWASLFSAIILHQAGME